MRAKFIEPMLLLRTEKLSEGGNWIYEINFDGYRAITFKTRGKIHPRSRNDNGVEEAIVVRSHACRVGAVGSERGSCGGRWRTPRSFRNDRLRKLKAECRCVLISVQCCR